MLHRLCGSGHVEFVRPLLHKLREAQMSILPGDARLLTLLHYAAGRNRKDVVSFLIEAGTDMHAKDNHSNATLHLAAVAGATDVMPLLVQTGADVNAGNPFPLIRLPLLRQVSQIEKMLCKFSRVLILHTKLYVL
jgi:ankyrin repeat protein